MYFTISTTASLLLLAPSIIASPVKLASNPAVTKRAPTIEGCTGPQQKEKVETAVTHVSGLAIYAQGLLSDGDKWKANKGYTHYFKESDKDQVLKAYEQFMSNDYSFNIRCIAEADCPANTLAFADALPEDFEDDENDKGTRYVNICPAFFSDERTQRDLPPFSDDDTPEIQEFCKFKESKKIKDFETGGHTLLHEFSHLDTFGIAAGYPKVHHTPTNQDPLKYDYHGTVDWKGSSTAGNARTLKTSSAKNKPETWQNAESLAAAATEMRAMALCDLAEVNL